MRIAVMQPYFVPYLGYFRLLAAADLFVAYDCVQFPRRGWVHRNQLLDDLERPQWLTLPLAPAAFDTRIDGLAFADLGAREMAVRLNRFPVCRAPKTERGTELLAAARRLDEPPAAYICRLLGLVAAALGIATPILRSSTLNLPAELRHQDRILAICSHFGASAYLNAPGGRELYDSAAFKGRGISLSFLTDYRGSMLSVMQRLGTEDPAVLRQELDANLDC